MSRLGLLRGLGLPREMINALEDEVGTADSDLYWDDIRVPLTRDKQGQLQKPDYDFVNMGLLFPNSNPAEIIYISAQMSHGMLLGSNLYPHIHFVQAVPQQPTFKMDYRWYENGSNPLGAFTTVTAATFAFPWAGVPLLQIASFPPIDGSAITRVSSMLDIKLYRDDAVVPGDVLAKEFDMHYQIDSRGSQLQYIKG